MYIHNYSYALERRVIANNRHRDLICRSLRAIPDTCGAQRRIPNIYMRVRAFARSCDARVPRQIPTRRAMTPYNRAPCTLGKTRFVLFCSSPNHLWWPLHPWHIGRTTEPCCLPAKPAGAISARHT